MPWGPNYPPAPGLPQSNTCGVAGALGGVTVMTGGPVTGPQRGWAVPLGSEFKVSE